MIGFGVVAGRTGAVVLDRSALGVHFLAVAFAAGGLRRAVGGRGRNSVAMGAITGLRPGGGVVCGGRVAGAATARRADALVADGAIAVDGGQRIAMVKLRDRCCVASLATAADELDRAVAVFARLGRNGGTDGHGLAVVRAGGAGVAAGAGDVGRYRVGVAPRTIPCQVVVGRVMLRSDGRLAGTDMAGGAVLLQGTAIGCFVAGRAGARCVNGGHVVHRRRGRTAQLFMATPARLVNLVCAAVTLGAIVKIAQAVFHCVVAAGSAAAGGVTIGAGCRLADPLVAGAAGRFDPGCRVNIVVVGLRRCRFGAGCGVAGGARPCRIGHARMTGSAISACC